MREDMLMKTAVELLKETQMTMVLLILSMLVKIQQIFPLLILKDVMHISAILMVTV